MEWLSHDACDHHRQLLQHVQEQQEHLRSCLAGHGQCDVPGWVLNAVNLQQCFFNFTSVCNAWLRSNLQDARFNALRKMKSLSRQQKEVVETNGDPDMQLLCEMLANQNTQQTLKKKLKMLGLPSDVTSLEKNKETPTARDRLNSGRNRLEHVPSQLSSKECEQLYQDCTEVITITCGGQVTLQPPCYSWCDPHDTITVLATAPKTESPSLRMAMSRCYPPLQGRDSEMQQIRQVLNTPNAKSSRIIIRGERGMGKSTLACEAVYEFQMEHSTLACFVPSTLETDAKTSLLSFARYLDLSIL